MAKSSTDTQPRFGKGIVGMVLGVCVAAVSLVMEFEGTRHAAYLDTGNVPTICTGHTRGVQMGDVATQAQCEIWLDQDLQVAAVAVAKHVKVPINKNEQGAYASFVFNVGETQFKNSTMLRLLNQGKHYQACNQLSRWVYDNGKRLPGLARRRAAELKLCMTPSKEMVQPWTQ